MSFKIDTFTSKLTKGGALGSLFECEVFNAKGKVDDIANFKFCLLYTSDAADD